MFSVWSVVREDILTEEREKERETSAAYMYVCVYVCMICVYIYIYTRARAHTYIRDLYDRMHTKIRYTEGLGSVSPLLFT